MEARGAAEEKLDHALSVPLTAEQYHQLKREARLENYRSLSEYIRQRYFGISVAGGAPRAALRGE